MRIGDIAVHAANVLPTLTDYFTTTATLQSAVVAADGSSASITTQAAHGLSVGDSVQFGGLGFLNPIAAVAQVGGRVTLTTSVSHDLTLGWSPHATILLDGFTEASLNADRALVAVPNRREFVISTSEMVTLNGNENLVEIDRIDALFGAFTVASVVSDTEFTVNAAAGESFAVGSFIAGAGKIQTKPRIIPVADPPRSMEIYTKHLAGQFFMFIVPANIEASKDRRTFSDATAERTSGTDQYQRIVDGFECYIFAPTSGELTGAQALDICRHDLLQAMTKTFTGVHFDAGTSAGVQPFRTVMLNSGVEGYNEAFLIYRYAFQQSFDLTNEDRYVPPTSAFRDIDLGLTTDAAEATGQADLDEEPIS